MDFFNVFVVLITTKLIDASSSYDVYKDKNFISTKELGSFNARSKMTCLFACNLNEFCLSAAYKEAARNEDNCFLYSQGVSNGIITHQNEVSIYTKKRSGYGESCEVYACKPNTGLVCDGMKSCVCENKAFEWSKELDTCVNTLFKCPSGGALIYEKCCQFNSLLNWNDAKAACESNGMELFSYAKGVPVSHISALFQNVWIGLTNVGPGWFWTDGRAFLSFASEVCSNFVGKVGCGIISGGKVCQTTCTSKYKYVCEKL